MKLRRLAEDFRVEEQCRLRLGASGAFGVYRLTKRHWNTLDCLHRLAKLLRIPRRNLAHAGLKDRHAVTAQFITIRNGPRRSLAEENFSLEYLGQSPRAIQAGDIVANRFQIVLRSLSPAERTRAETALPQVLPEGIPNYFDDQRFGSFLPGCEFVAEAWIREDYERALWLAFAEHRSGDEAAERREKQILRQHWNDWSDCKRLLSRSHRRSIVTYLDDKGGDFKGAWGRVRGELRGLYLSAFQSHLWNQIAGGLIRRTCRPEQLGELPLKPGAVPCFHDLEGGQIDALFETRIPLPSARLKLDPGPLRERIETELEQLGWLLADLKVKFPRDRFFSRGWRPLAVPLPDLSWEFAADELDADREKLTLQFSLPPGSYATILVKRLTGSAVMH